MAITGGFGVMMDLSRGGAMRRWVMGRDGVKRWHDSGEPCKTEEPREAGSPSTPGSAPISQRDFQAKSEFQVQTDAEGSPG